MNNINTHPIQQLNQYTSSMEKSLNDKLFWINKISPDDYSTVIDFGCANGILLSAISTILPDKQLIGIDSNPIMRSMAANSCPSARLYDSLEAYCKEHETADAILILSSVLHEIFSYWTDYETQHFFQLLTDLQFKYICIRDMFFDDFPFFFDDPLPYLNDAEKERRKQFESIWGSTFQYVPRLHYLCKYRYANNWERELNECYIIDYSKLRYIYGVLSDTYELVSNYFYILPFLQEQVMKDFHFNIDKEYNSTHFQSILTRRIQ